MKKFISVFFAFLLLLCGCAACTAEMEYETISVPVRKESIHYNEDGTQSETELELWKYDKNGNCTVNRDYYNGILAFTVRYSYDRRGNETGKTTICHGRWLPEWVSREKKAYDENGNMTLHVEYDLWEEEERYLYTYDDSGKLIRFETRRPNGRTAVEVYTYDENGNLLTETEESFIGMVYTTMYFYDEAGQQIRVECYREDHLYEYVERVFDSQGRETYTALYDENGEVVKFWEYTYNDAENTITLNCSDVFVYVCYLNDWQQVIQRDNYDSEGDLICRDVYTYKEIKIPKK